MTIHEMLHQVSLLSSGIYRRSGAVSSIEIPLPNGRRQIIYGKVSTVGKEEVGLLYTNVGELNETINLRKLLELNATLRHAKITIFEGKMLVLIAMFDLIFTSIKECAPILQEIAAVADELERIYFKLDVR